MEKSPLRYPGGKSRAVEFLSNFIPEFSEMREVFFGGGSLSFYYVQKFGDRKYLASDLNFELYCFWSQLKDNSKELIEGVQCLYDQYKDAGDANDENGRKLFDLLVSRRNENITEIKNKK